MPVSCFFRAKALLLITATVLSTNLVAARAQEAEQEIATDGGSRTVLQSIHIPLIKNAPFSLTLATEWARPMSNGGSFTIVNSRQIKRDRDGRLYEERWLLTPKGGEHPSTMSYIQIADPAARTLYNCNVPRHSCELLTLSSAEAKLLPPSSFKSGPLPNGKGNRVHEDLGEQTFAGLPVHGYRDTTTLEPACSATIFPCQSFASSGILPILVLTLRRRLKIPNRVARPSLSPRSTPAIQTRLSSRYQPDTKSSITEDPRPNQSAPRPGADQESMFASRFGGDVRGWVR